MTGRAPILLDVRELETSVIGRTSRLALVRNVTFALSRGETLALVGESGCGKSMTALSILQILPDPPCRITGGSVRFDGAELVGLTDREMCAIRGRRIAMIFQEPMTSLNPVLSIGRQVTDAIRAHRAMARSAAQARAIELLQLVEIPDPKRRLREYPHQLSGGMRQRVMIAMALGAQPELLIADEPTTALDATIQAQILALLTGLKNRLGLAILFITHNLGLVAEYADRVAVMYAGRIVEEGPVRDVLAAPAHPYTRGLLGARPHARRAGEPRQRLVEIPGQVPQPAALPRGCPFAPRCPNAITGCGAAEPPLEERGPNRRRVACIRIGEA